MNTVRQQEVLSEACAAVMGSRPINNALFASMDQAVDWPVIAAEQRVVPLLAAALRQARGQGIEPPPEIFRALQHKALSLGMNAARIEASLSDVLDALVAATLPCLVVKGPAVARQAYDTPDLRPFDDIDLFVPEDALPKAFDVLTDIGLVPHDDYSVRQRNAAFRVGLDIGLWDPSRNVFIEIGTLGSRRHLGLMSWREAWERSVSVDIAGRNTQTLSPADALLFAAVHGATHGWTRLIWLTDVIGLIRRMRLENQSIALERARHYDCARALGLALHLSEQRIGWLPSFFAPQSTQVNRNTKPRASALRAHDLKLKTPNAPVVVDRNLATLAALPINYRLTKLLTLGKEDNPPSRWRFALAMHAYPINRCLALGHMLLSPSLADVYALDKYRLPLPLALRRVIRLTARLLTRDWRWGPYPYAPLRGRAK